MRSVWMGITIQLALLGTLGLTTIVGSPAAMAKSDKKCVFKGGDIGEIIGRGGSIEAATEDAITQCFEERRRLYRANNNGQESDFETGELYIDLCVNMKCQ